MLQGKQSTILSTFIKLIIVIKIFVLSIFEWPFYTGYTVNSNNNIQKLIVFQITGVVCHGECSIPDNVTRNVVSQRSSGTS